MGAIEMVEHSGRKSFSGSGRKRKAGPREPSGRVQRISTSERQADVIAVVLAQPHRLGSGDGWRETPLGRLLLDKRVHHSSASADELWRASCEYAQAFSNVRRVWDSRRPWAVSEGRIPADLSEEQRIKYERDWGDIQRALRDAGVMAQKAVEYLLQDAPPHDEERTYAFWLTHGAGVGLAALARHFGILSIRLDSRRT